MEQDDVIEVYQTGGSNQLSSNPQSCHLVHVVIEWPLMIFSLNIITSQVQIFLILYCTAEFNVTYAFILCDNMYRYGRNYILSCVNKNKNAHAEFILAHCWFHGQVSCSLGSRMTSNFGYTRKNERICSFLGREILSLLAASYFVVSCIFH